MATRRPSNGRRVFVALDDVHPALRARVADWLACKKGATLPMPAKQRAALEPLRTDNPIHGIELGMAAVTPRARASGRPYGVWCNAAEAARAKAGVWPVVRRG